MGNKIILIHRVRKSRGKKKAKEIKYRVHNKRQIISLQRTSTVL